MFPPFSFKKRQCRLSLLGRGGRRSLLCAFFSVQMSLATAVPVNVLKENSLVFCPLLLDAMCLRQDNCSWLMLYGAPLDMLVDKGNRLPRLYDGFCWHQELFASACSWTLRVLKPSLSVTSHQHLRHYYAFQPMYVGWSPR